MSYRGSGLDAGRTGPQVPFAVNTYSQGLNQVNDVGMGRSRRTGGVGSDIVGNDLVQKFEKFVRKIEDLTDHGIVQKVVPYTPTIARFLVVATFFEDSFRIISQWKEQIAFLAFYRRINYWFVLFFLLTVTVAMMAGATMILLRKQTLYATVILCGCIVSQGLVYGLFNGAAFVLRSFSVIGGLLITFGDSIVKNKVTFGMLPELSSKDGRMKGYILLTGRILLVFMFITFTFKKNWFTVILTIAGSICIAVGYKTKFASIVLCMILTFYNITLNNYWFYSTAKRDLLKYEFYQNLNIIGGLLLVVNTGAGNISFDEKKKIY